MGYGRSCGGQIEVPCNIETTTSKKGCYFSCNTERVDNKTSYFLVRHPNLIWIPTDSNRVNSITDTIKINGGKNPLMFGRVMYKGNYQLGKVHAQSGRYRLTIQGQGGEISFINGFEVLSCSAMTKQTCGEYYDLRI